MQASWTVAPRQPMVFAVVGWGDRVGEGVYGARFCTLPGVVKSDIEPEGTCLAANEYICNRLALALGLPAPPGGLIRIADGRVAFVSLRFGSLKDLHPLSFLMISPETTPLWQRE